MLCTYALYTTRCRTTGTTLQYQRIPGKVWLYHEGGVRHWHSTVLRPLFRADAQRIYEAQHGEELREQPESNGTGWQQSLWFAPRAGIHRSQHRQCDNRPVGRRRTASAATPASAAALQHCTPRASVRERRHAPGTEFCEDEKSNVR